MSNTVIRSGPGWEQCPAGWVSGRPVWCHFAVAHSWRPPQSTHSATPGCSPAGVERSSSSVPGWLEHPGISQSTPQPQPRGAPTLGVPGLWSRARATRLGPAARAHPWAWGRSQHGQQTGVSALPNAGALRALVARLRTCFLCRCRCPHPCLCSLRPRMLREDGSLLGRDTATTRDPRLPAHLPLLLNSTDRHARVHQAHLSRTHWLTSGHRRAACRTGVFSDCKYTRWQSILIYHFLKHMHTSYSVMFFALGFSSHVAWTKLLVLSRFFHRFILALTDWQVVLFGFANMKPSIRGQTVKLRLGNTFLCTHM